jgi:TRAP-type C4-dicarboxylate transport system permease small subunit
VSEQDAASSFLTKAEATGRFLENVLLSTLLACMIGLAATQIGLRWAGFGSLAWGDEAVRLMVLWIAMVAGIAAAREDRHIAIDVLSRFLKPRGKALTAVVVDLFTALVCAALAWYGWGMVRFALEDGERLLSGNMPAWLLQAIIPAAFLLMSYRYMLSCIRRIRELLIGPSER